MKPTDSEVKEFWEKCGTDTPFEDCETTCQYCEHWACPPIDLNNLFKYAVPIVKRKLGEKGFLDYEMLLKQWVNHFVWRDEDPADTLFWAIKEATK